MKYNERDLRILAALEMRADEPLPALARECRCKVSTVRYALAKFIEDGVIVTRRVYLNPDIVGFTNYAFYLTLALGRHLDEFSKFRAYLSKQPRVNWFAEIGGDYQCAFRVSVKSLKDLLELWERLGKTFGQTIIRKEASIRAASSTFARSFLEQQPARTVEFRQGGEARHELSEVDRRVLTALSTEGFESFRALAARFDIPSSTFDRRIKALHKLGVIQGHYYILNVERLGLNEFRLLLHTRGHGANLTSRLRQFAKSHPRIRKYIQCLGSWDYELEITVRSGKEAAAIAALIQAKFRDEIEYVRTVPLFGEVNCPPYAEVC